MDYKVIIHQINHKTKVGVQFNKDLKAYWFSDYEFDSEKDARRFVYNVIDNTSYPKGADILTKVKAWKTTAKAILKK